MGNYGLTLRAAMKFPLSAAVALWPALCARNGFEHAGLDYVTREGVAAGARMQAHIDKTYTINPTNDVS